MEQSRKHRRKKKKNWWIRGPLYALLAIFIFSALYIGYILNSIRSNVDNRMFEEVTVVDREQTERRIRDKENINVLLLGIDSDSEISGRSDAIMVMTLKPASDEVQLVSIPRDTRTMIVGRGNEDKINHAHAFGGADMAISTVENFLDIDIDYFARINMDGMEELVDLVGPITVDNHLSFSQGGDTFPTGPITLNGSQTMNYVRMRKQDPSGDFGRTERQRKVIEGIIKEGASFSNVTQIVSIVESVGSNVGTNMEFSDMIRLFQNYNNTARNFNSYQMQGSGTMINGIYYFIVPEEEVNKVNTMINEL